MNDAETGLTFHAQHQELQQFRQLALVIRQSTLSVRLHCMLGQFLDTIRPETRTPVHYRPRHAPTVPS